MVRLGARLPRGLATAVPGQRAEHPGRFPARPRRRGPSHALSWVATGAAQPKLSRVPVELESIKSSLLAHGVTPGRLAMGAAAFAGGVLLTLVIGTLVIVRLPATYFQEASSAPSS